MQQNNPRSARSKQVRLHVYENEPTARMAEQRLFSQGVPAMVRSLEGGPGLWGTAYNMPHGLYVFQEDVPGAREILGLDSGECRDDEGDSAERRSPGLIWVVAGIGVALMLIVAAWALLAG